MQADLDILAFGVRPTSAATPKKATAKELATRDVILDLRAYEEEPPQARTRHVDLPSHDGTARHYRRACTVQGTRSTLQWYL